MPKPTFPGRRPLGLVVLLALALFAAGCGKENPRPLPRDITEYVALGDSYTAVAGNGPLTDQACFRSNRDYPALVAQRLDISDAENVSCGGADSSDLEQAQTNASGATMNQPQFDALNADVKLVTLGIGLNNAGLSYYTLYSCLPINGKTPEACQAYLDLPDDKIVNAIKAVGRTVQRNIKAIRKLAPQARIVLVGYPRLLPDTGSCEDQVPLPPAALDRTRTVLSDMNATLKSAALSTRVDYIDMYTASEGHDVCSSDPWVNGRSNIDGKAIAFHPYDSYHVAVADKIAALVGKL